MNLDNTLEVTLEKIQQDVQKLGKWFHNIDLNGVKTAPDHFLGDYPNVKFQNFANAIPADLSGKSVLDIGCNAGFYSIEMKRRGASHVIGIDSDERYLAQARYAAKVLGVDIDFRNMSVYDVGSLGEKFDVVIFMGVLYHLRHPLLALDLLYENVVKNIFVFQSMQRGSDEIEPVENDYDFWQTEIFQNYNFPQMYFIENRYANDPTNWWIPNRSCMEAMLRSSGFEIAEHPGETMLEAQLRIVNGLQKILFHNPNETVVVVSHADIIKSAVAYYAGIPLDLMQRLEISPASISILELFDDTVRLALLNYTGKL